MEKDLLFKHIKDKMKEIVLLMREYDSSVVNIRVAVDLKDNYISVNNGNWDLQKSATLDECCFDFMKEV